MKHIGFIMDGNRTWAKMNSLPQLEGHRRGYGNAKVIIKLCKKYEIPYVSFWALSDDNIRSRSTEEVTYLFLLLEKGILDLAKEAQKDNIRIVCVGDRNLLPEKVTKSIESAEKMTANNTTMTAILAIGYGGQEEVVRAVQKIIEEGIPSQDITRDILLSRLDTGAFPPPDLIIRTGNHVRHSGYFLFQSPYSEYYFSELNWPDFNEDELIKALNSFEKSERKFGK